LKELEKEFRHDERYFEEKIAKGINRNTGILLGHARLHESEEDSEKE